MRCNHKCLECKRPDCNNDVIPKERKHKDIAYAMMSEDRKATVKARQKRYYLRHRDEVCAKARERYKNK